MREGDTRLIDAARHGGERACRRPQLRRDVGIGVIPTDAEEGVGVEKANWLHCLALLPDGLRFVSGSSDNTACIAYHGLAPAK